MPIIRDLHPRSDALTRLGKMALTISLTLTTSLAAALETDGRHSATELDEIKVTANPLRSTAEQLSEPTEVLQGERLDQVRAATLGETVNGLPGVQSTHFGAGVGRPIIRGQEGPRVAVLSGGMSVQDVSTVSQDHATAVEPFLADQIEVLKGPATMLFGSGAIGGIVNVVDGRIPERAPEVAFSGRSEVRYNDNNRGNTELIRIDTGDARYALHFDAVRRDQQDYDTPIGKQANSFLNTRSGAAGGSIFGSWGFFGVAASRYEDAYGNPGEPGDAVAGDAPVSLDIAQDRFEAKGGMDHPFQNIESLRYALTRTDYQHVEFEGDEVGTRFNKKATEGRIELSHREFSGWLGALGLQFEDGEFEAIGDEAFVPRTKSKNIGVFLVERKQWQDLQLDLGARIDDGARAPIQMPSRSFNPASLSAGAIWRLSSNWDVLLNLDHAERAPGEEELFADGPHIATASYEIGNARFNKERSNQVEFGMHLHRDRLSMKASVYQNRFSDFIYLADTNQIADELPVRQWTQAGATFRGWEAEGNISLIDSARGALDLRVFGDSVRATLANDGSNLPRIVPGRIGADLRWADQNWRASLVATEYQRQDRVAAAESVTDGYTWIDAHFAWHCDQSNTAFEVFLDATNLSNQQARVHTSYLKDRVLFPGRSWTLGLRAFF